MFSAREGPGPALSGSAPIGRRRSRTPAPRRVDRPSVISTGPARRPLRSATGRWATLPRCHHSADSVVGPE